MVYSLSTYCQKPGLDLLKIKKQVIENYEYDVQELPQRLKSDLKNTAPKEYGNPPALSWIEQFGGSANDLSTALEIDKNGNTFITGSFAGKVVINNITHNSVGNREAFVAKFNKEGIFQWFTAIPSSASNETHCNDISLDTNGNVFATGYYTGSINISTISFPENNIKTLFYIKLDTDGNIINGNYYSKNFDEEGLSIDNDQEGNVYIASQYKSETDGFYSNSTLLKYNKNALLTWEKDFAKFFKKLVIVNSNIYYCGVIFEGESGYVDPNVTLSTSNYSNEVFILKSNLNAEFEWGLSSSGYNWDEGLGFDLSTNNTDTLFLVGYFRGNLSFGTKTIYGYQNFCLKFDDKSNIKWLIKTDHDKRSTSPHITTDSEGNSFMVINNNLYKINDDGNYKLLTSLDFYPSSLDIHTKNKLLLTGGKDGLIYLSETDNLGLKQWDFQITGNTGLTNMYDIESDSERNIYAFAYSGNTTQYFGEQVKKGFVLGKHNEKGELLWHKNLIGNIEKYNLYAKPVDLNETSGNIYLTGVYYDSIKISDTKTLSSRNEKGIFILKYDINGNQILAINEEFKGFDPSVVSNLAGEIILSFTFEDTIVVNNTDTIISRGGEDGCVVKYNADGGYMWSKQIGGKESEYSCLISSDNLNNIYVTSECWSTNVLLGDTDITLNEGDGNMLLAKYSNDGNLDWWKTYGNNPKLDGHNWQTGIEVDRNENIILKGMFHDTAYFDDIMITGSLDYYDYFLTKIDKNGNTLWANPVKTINSSGFNYNLFDLDTLGNIYFGAQIRDTISFNQDFTYWTGGTTDLFICRYNNDGELDWVKTFQGGSNYSSHINAVKLDKDNNVIVAGSFNDKLTVDSKSISASNKHGFLLKLSDKPNSFAEKVYDKLSNTIEIYPNPAREVLYISGRKIAGQSVNIVNTSGQVVYSKHLSKDKSIIDINHLSQGVYFIMFSGCNYKHPEKLIIK
jgi:hypothetical protein